MVSSRLMVVVASVLCALISGCAQPPHMLQTDPDKAMLEVDGREIGQSPREHKFDFGAKDKYIVTAKLEGYFESQKEVTSDTDSPVVIEMTIDEAWQRTRPSEATNKWLVVQVNRRFSREECWQRLVNIVTDRYSSLEVMDPVSGYIRSVPLTETFRHPSRGEYTVRTQFLGSIANLNPLTIKIQIRSEESDKMGRWRPYNRVFAEDAKLVEEIRDRLQ